MKLTLEPVDLTKSGADRPKKKILFIQAAPRDSEGNPVKARKAYMPPRTALYLAGLTPERFECSFVDEMVQDLDLDADIDLAVMTGMLHHVPGMIGMARKFRERGTTTVAGGVGIHTASAMNLDLSAFDCIVHGEAETVWEKVLCDFEKGSLNKTYQATETADLSRMPFTRFDLLDASRYKRSFFDRKRPMVLIETSRGCPHQCNFCLVSRYFGRKMRYRPVADVVEEIRHHKGKFVFFTDDNILVSRTRARELFSALKPLGIHWQGSFDCTAIRHLDLLEMAGESGCVSAFIGLESLIRSNYDSHAKHQNRNIDPGELARSFRQAGILPVFHMIFGMDHDTEESIAWTFDELIRIHAEFLMPWILTPLPTTPIFDEFKAQNRLLHMDVARYDSMHPVFKPKNIAPDALDKATWLGLKRFYGFRGVLRRIILRKDFFKRRALLFPAFILNLYARRLVMLGKHPSANE